MYRKQNNVNDSVPLPAPRRAEKIHRVVRSDFAINNNNNVADTSAASYAHIMLVRVQRHYYYHYFPLSIESDPTARSVRESYD